MARNCLAPQSISSEQPSPTSIPGIWKDSTPATPNPLDGSAPNVTTDCRLPLTATRFVPAGLVQRCNHCYLPELCHAECHSRLKPNPRRISKQIGPRREPAIGCVGLINRTATLILASPCAREWQRQGMVVLEDWNRTLNEMLRRVQDGSFDGVRGDNIDPAVLGDRLQVPFPSDINCWCCKGENSAALDSTDSNVISDNLPPGTPARQFIPAVHLLPQYVGCRALCKAVGWNGEQNIVAARRRTYKSHDPSTSSG